MTKKQKDFVQMYLRHRCKITAHNIVYGENPNFDSVESSANRLLRNPEIAEAIRSVEDALRHEVEEEFKAKYREELLTIYDKRLLLKKIATGEIYIEQKYKGKNCTQCSQYISSNINQMLAGLREDSKVAGHYPYKQNGKWVIPALEAEQAQKEKIPTPEKDNKTEQIPETTIDNQPLTEINSDSISPPTTEFTEEQENALENVSPLHRVPYAVWEGERGKFREELPDENTPEKDNKRQQIEENSIYNTANYQSCECEHDSPISRRSFSEGGPDTIISQEKLKELLYPKKPKLSYMKNNP